MKQNKYYSQEFKDQAISLVENSGKLQKEVARDLNISPKLLSRWMSDKRRKLERAKYPNESSEEKIFRLEKEVSSLRKDNAILKKSLGILFKA